MKQCPECRRVYGDETLNYCLDDGAELLYGAAEPATAVMPSGGGLATEPTRVFEGGTTAGRRTVGRAKTPLFAAAGVIALIAAGFAAYWFYPRTPEDQITSIAVMPFVNETGDTALEYLSDGMTETLVNSLLQVPNLNVKARSSVFRYKGRDIVPGDVGRELGVKVLLNGRLVKHEDSLSVFLELVDVGTGNRVWGETFDRKMSEIVPLQNEIAQSVVRKLSAKLTGRDEQRFAKNYTTDSEAYQLYLKGLFQLNKRTEESFRAAVSSFEQAIEKDPKYALAYAGLAESYNQMGFYNTLSPADSFPKAKAAALKALAIDNDVGEAHAAFAFASLIYDWNFARADEEYQKALALNPRDVNARHMHGYQIYVSDRRRFSEAINEMKIAKEQDPLSLPIQFNIAALLYFERQNDKALDELRSLQRSDPNFTLGYGLAGAIYREKGMFNESVEAILKGSSLEGAALTPGQVEILAATYKKSGFKAFCIKHAEILQEAAKQAYISPIFMAMAYAAAGEKDLTIKWLEKAIEDRSGWVVEIPSEPVWDLVRDDPRYQELIKKVGFPA